MGEEENRRKRFYLKSHIVTAISFFILPNKNCNANCYINQIILQICAYVYLYFLQLFINGIICNVVLHIKGMMDPDEERLTSLATLVNEGKTSGNSTP